MGTHLSPKRPDFSGLPSETVNVSCVKKVPATPSSGSDGGNCGKDGGGVGKG